MSTQAKLIVPLLNEDFSKDDFTEETGFIDAYINNINMPHLLNHLFLLYKAEDRTYKGAVLMSKIQSMKSLYNWKTIKINGHYYTLYILTLVGSKMKNLLKGIPSFERSDVEKTLKFWNLEETDVNRILLGEDPLLRIDNSSVPEEDYSYPDLTTELGYKESLAIENNSLAFLLRLYITEYYKRNFLFVIYCKRNFLLSAFTRTPSRSLLLRFFWFFYSLFFWYNKPVYTSIA